MIRKVVIAVCFVLTGMVGFAQDHMPSRMNTYTDEGEGTGFLKQNLFIGGSLGLGFGTDQFNIGVNPEIGYSLNRWLDAGVVVNFNYNSISADPSGYYNPDVSEKQFIYGGGLFARAWVLPFLFLTAQPEFNWTNDTEKYEASGGQHLYSQCQCAQPVAGDRVWTSFCRSEYFLYRVDVRCARQ